MTISGYVIGQSPPPVGHAEFFKSNFTLLSPAMAKARLLSCSGGRCVKTKDTYRAISDLEVNEIYLLPSPPTDTSPLVTSRLKILFSCIRGQQDGITKKREIRTYDAQM